jgi:hypothetical protein
MVGSEGEAVKVGAKSCAICVKRHVCLCDVLVDTVKLQLAVRAAIATPLQGPVGTIPV